MEELEFVCKALADQSLSQSSKLLRRRKLANGSLLSKSNELELESFFDPDEDECEWDFEDEEEECECEWLFEEDE